MIPDDRGWMSDPDVEAIPSTEAKNLFGALLDKAIAGKRVVITRRDTPKAVLIGFEAFESLRQGTIQGLATLAEAFDERLVRMQTTKARAATKRAFDATPKRLGKAAVRAARRRD